MRRFILIFILFILMGACSSRTPADTGVEGLVYIGPVCPVVQVNNPCPDKPYQASFTILNTTGKKITKFTTLADGSFKVPLAAGKYTLHPDSPNGITHAADQPFTVVKGQYIRLTITFDSGIR